jgi:hypothetical protein
MRDGRGQHVVKTVDRALGPVELTLNRRLLQRVTGCIEEEGREALGRLPLTPLSPYVSVYKALHGSGGGSCVRFQPASATPIRIRRVIATPNH